MSEAATLLRTLAGEDEWSRHAVLERLREEGLADGGLEELRDALDDDADATRRSAARMALAALAAPGGPDSDDALRLLTAAIRSPGADLRVLAASALGETGNAGAVSALVGALDDTEPNVVAAAADALGSLRHPAAIGPLAERAEAGEFWIRAAAVVALGRIRDPRAIPALARAADEPHLDQPVVEALRSIDDPDVLPVLGELAPRVGLPALLAAGAVLCAHPDEPAPDWIAAPVARAADALRERLLREDDPAAARLLGMTATPATLEELVDLVGPPRSSEAALAGVLAAPAGPRAEALLAALDAPGADPAARVALLSLLPPLRDEHRIRRLVPFLDDDDPAVRAAAAESLARAPAREALPLLRSVLERQATVAPEVLRAMGGLGTEACLALTPLLADDAPGVRAAAAEALARCGGPEVTDRIAETLAGEAEPEVRAALLRALGHAAGEDAVARLGAALEDEDPALRLAAIEGLAATGSPAALEALRRPLDGDTPEAMAALRAIGDLGAPEGAALVVPFLRSGDPDVRRVAASAAMLLGRSLPADAVTAMADDDDEWVRIAAARVLARRGRAARDRLRGMAADDPSPHVRAAARRGLEGVE